MGAIRRQDDSDLERIETRTIEALWKTPSQGKQGFVVLHLGATVLFFPEIAALKGD
jgi:hypothetical protein